MDTRITSSERSLGFTVTVALAVTFTGLAVLGGGWTAGLVVGGLLLVGILGADRVGVFASQVEANPSLGQRLDVADRVWARAEAIAAAEQAHAAVRPIAALAAPGPAELEATSASAA